MCFQDSCEISFVIAFPEIKNRLKTGEIMKIPHNIAINTLEASLHLDDSIDRS